MTRNLTILLIAMSATLATGASASTAMAAEFHSETGITDLFANPESTNIFTTDSGTIHCTTATFTGTLVGTTTVWAELAPSYSGCRSTGFIEALVTVDVNRCRLNLNASSFFTQEAHLTGCESGKPGIVFTAPFCTITVTPQTLSSVSFSNTGSGTTREVIAEMSVSNMSYHESGFACKNGTASTTGGGYAGKIRLTGRTVSGFHAGLYVG